MVTHLFPTVDIGMTALPVAAAVFLNAFVLQGEMKTVPTTTTRATMNEMCRGMLSTPPFNPRPREGKG